MEVRTLTPFFKHLFSKISATKPTAPNFGFKSQKQQQFRSLICRDLYTHAGPRPSGILAFDENRKRFEQECQGKVLPSWLENCRCVNQEEVEGFYKAFPAFVEDVTSLSCTNKLLLGNQRLREMTEHIVPWAPVQGVQVIATDRFYVERSKRNGKGILNEETHGFLVHKLAWTLEMIARNAYVTDDIIDGSDKRNGLACWHTLPNIGLSAINDYCSLVTGGLLVLERHFRSKDYYAELVKFVLGIMHVTVVSTNELHAMKSTPSCEQNLDRIYNNGQTHASSSSFEEMLAVKSVLNASVLLNLPIIGTMIMHGVRDPALIQQAQEMGYKVMESCMLVDDWIDCFATMEVTERETTDIQAGRQSWLIWKAINLGSQEQCQRLAECYGKNDTKCVEEVKEIYRQLNIKDEVSKMAEDHAKAVEAEIEKLPHDDLPCGVWLNMLNHYRDVLAGKAARP